MRKEKLLDDILKHFYDNRLNGIMVANIWKNYTDTDKEFYELILDLQKDNLIRISSYKQYTNPAMNLYIITSHGITVYQAGGIEKYQTDQAEKEEKQRIKENMEYQSLSASIIHINKVLQDYERVKSQAFWGTLIATISLIVAIAALIWKK